MTRDDSPPTPAPDVFSRRRRRTRATRADAQALSRLIGSVYQGAMDPVPWLSALDALRQTLGVAHAGLLLRPRSTQPAEVTIHTDGFSARANHTHETLFFALDPFLRLPPGEPVAPEDLAGARWTGSVLYREFLRPFDVGPTLGADVTTADGVECRLRIARARGAAPFTPDERLLCRLLLPHLRRSIELHGRFDELPGEQQLLAGGVRRMPLGVVTLTHDGSVHALNAEAQRMLETGDGLAVRSGRLRAASQDDERALAQLLDAACADGAGAPALAPALCLTRPSGRPGFAVIARALPASGSATAPALVVHLRDPEAPMLPASGELLRRRFGLTRTEAELALCLAEGASVAEAAERLGVGDDAARACLRVALSKTGVTRQAALTQLVLNSRMSLYARV
ncbi:MAG: helix-turn-helix transcriptional regulator [Gammaproteobacteria bacterium]